MFRNCSLSHRRSAVSGKHRAFLETTRDQWPSTRNGKVKERMEERNGVREPPLRWSFPTLEINLEETEAWAVKEAAASHSGLGSSPARIGAPSSGTRLTFLGSRTRIRERGFKALTT